MLLLPGASIALKFFEENGYTFRGKQLCHFHCCAEIIWDHLIEENLLPSEQIHSFKGRPHFRTLYPPGKQTGIHENYLPPNMAEKDGGVPIHLKSFVIKILSLPFSRLIHNRAIE